jgi:hypothetical protein
MLVARTKPGSDQRRHGIKIVLGIMDGGIEGLEMVQELPGVRVLTRPVVDQTALHGILSKIRDPGVPLLSVER